MSGDYGEHVRAWADELRHGSTRTWTDFVAATPPSTPPSSGELPPEMRETARPVPGSGPGNPLPTAAQLEVVRRLAAGGDLPDFTGLADLVLRTAGTGRGRIDVPLPWAQPPAFGTPPVAPEELGADELLRVVGATIGRLMVEGPPAQVERPRRSWRPFRRQFLLLGAPSSARMIGEALAARGLREGGHRPTYIVLAGPLEQMMAQRWAARIRAGSTIRWRPFWRYSRNHDRIPPAIQAPLLANRLAHEVGGARVHVVVAPDTATAMGTVAGIFGVAPEESAGKSTGEIAEPAEVSATDLLRVVNASLAVGVGREERARLVDTVWPALVPPEEPRRLGVPLRHLDWAIESAQRQVERLHEGSRAAGYAVHGDPAIVVPDPDARVQRTIHRRDTLELGLAVLGRAWTRTLGADAGPGAEQGEVS